MSLILRVYRRCLHSFQLLIATADALALGEGTRGPGRGRHDFDSVDRRFVGLEALEPRLLLSATLPAPDAEEEDQTAALDPADVTIVEEVVEASGHRPDGPTSPEAALQHLPDLVSGPSDVVVEEWGVGREIGPLIVLSTGGEGTIMHARDADAPFEVKGGSLEGEFTIGTSGGQAFEVTASPSGLPPLFVAFAGTGEFQGGGWVQIVGQFESVYDVPSPVVFEGTLNLPIGERGTYEVVPLPADLSDFDPDDFVDENVGDPADFFDDLGDSFGPAGPQGLEDGFSPFSTLATDFTSPSEARDGDTGVPAGLSEAANPLAPPPQFHKPFKLAGLHVGIEYLEFTTDGGAMIEGYVRFPEELMHHKVDVPEGNALLLNRGGVSIAAGRLEAGPINLPGPWKLNKINVGYEQPNNRFELEAEVDLPGPTRPGPGEMGGKLVVIDGAVDEFELEFDELNVPIGSTGAFLQRVMGGVKNLQSAPEPPIEASAGVGGTYGPEIVLPSTGELPDWLGGGKLEGALVRLDVDGTWSTEQIEVNGEVQLVSENLLSGEGDVIVNWAEGFLSLDGDLSGLGGLVEINWSLRGDTEGNLAGSGRGSVSTPDIGWYKRVGAGGIQLAQGTGMFQFTADGDRSDDYVAAWLDVPFVGQTGFQLHFDGEWRWLGADEIKPLEEEFALPSMSQTIGPASTDRQETRLHLDADQKRVLISASWEDPADDAAIELVDPDGTAHDRAAVEAHDAMEIVEAFSDETRLSVGLTDPDEGVWTIRGPAAEEVGEVEVAAVGAKPTGEVRVVDLTDEGAEQEGFVTVTIEAENAADDAVVDLFYDVDHEGHDGFLVAEGVTLEDGQATYNLDPTDIPQGEHTIYAVLRGGGQVPVFSEYAEGTVEGRDKADSGVIARHVFYNDSSYDGGDASPGPHNDAAVAPDRQPLGPGEEAMAQNITNAAQGLTGIMLDVADAPQVEALTEEALSFRMGNGDDLGNWIAAPSPQEVHVREGEGANDSDRVELIWPEHAIENQWLEVTVRADNVPDLDEDEVFYFGHRAGDVTGDGRVTAEDVQLIRENQSGFGSAGIDNAYDINRTGRVDLGDVIAARNNQDTEPLEMISVPTNAAPSAEPLIAEASADTTPSTASAMPDRLHAQAGWTNGAGDGSRFDALASLERWRSTTPFLDSAFDRPNEPRHSNWDHHPSGSALFGVDRLDLGLDEDEEDTILRIL